MILLLSVPAVYFALLAYDELFFHGSPKLALLSFVFSLGAMAAIGARWRPQRWPARVLARFLGVMIGIASVLWLWEFTARHLVQSPFVLAPTQIADLLRAGPRL